MIRFDRPGRVSNRETFVEKDKNITFDQFPKNQRECKYCAHSAVQTPVWHPINSLTLKH